MTDKRITGVMIYYYFVCKRKLWYFCHEINMESENENVQLGKLLDEKSYERDEKHINIDNVINIDFIREHQELHEIKKSKAIEEAGIWHELWDAGHERNADEQQHAGHEQYPDEQQYAGE